ncbi:MAG TPA: ATPase, T2SS/T4P/T4SS family, partial [Blastocatellia bacterium]
MSAKLGETLLKENLITPQQLKEALDYQRINGGRLASTLVKLGMLTDEEVTSVLSRQYGVPSVNLELFEVDPTAVALVPQETAERYSVLPLSRIGATLTLAMVDPTNVFAIDDIKFMTGLQVEPVVVSEAALDNAIKKHYGTSRELELARVVEDLVAESTAADEYSDADASFDLVEEEEIDLENLEKMADDAPVVKLVNVFMVDALRRGASDIHVEPYEKELRVRFRMDGVLYNIMNPPFKMRDALTSRLKIMARLDIAEKRLPQDGRIKLRVKLDGRSREIDFRVSTLPTIFGEKVVMRLLDKENLRLDMTQLGFEPESLEKF